MNCCGRCCRIIFSVFATIFALIGLVMVIYGGSRVTNVSLSDATSDSVADKLAPFINCVDQKNAMPQLNDGTDHDFDNAFMYRCESAQVPIIVGPILTGVVMFFASIAGLIAVNHSAAKTSVLVFNVLGATTIVLALFSVVLVALITNDTASELIPCNSFNNATITRLQSANFVCITGGSNGNNKTALKWLSDLVVIYVGSGFCILSVLFLLIAHKCIGSPQTDETLRQPLYPAQGYQYN